MLRSEMTPGFFPPEENFATSRGNKTCLSGTAFEGRNFNISAMRNRKFRPSFSAFLRNKS